MIQILAITFVLNRVFASNLQSERVKIRSIVLKTHRGRKKGIQLRDTSTDEFRSKHESHHAALRERPIAGLDTVFSMQPVFIR